MDAILISAKKNLVDVDDARNHLSDHDKLYWGVGFTIDKSKFSFPIFAFIHVTGAQVEYRALVTAIIPFDPKHSDDPSLKPEPWRQSSKNNSKTRTENELVLTEIVPFSFDTYSFQKYSGGSVQQPPQNYICVIPPSQSPNLSAQPSVRTSIAEKNLEEFVVQRLEAIETGLSLVARQLTTNAGRLDLLCKDVRGNYVVVELKRARSTDEVFGQILRYMGSIMDNYPNTKVRGVIIVGKKDDASRYAVKAAPNIEVKEFNISIR